MATREYDAERQRKRRKAAKARRRELIKLLGGQCAWCGCVRMPELEVNHVEPREWDIRGMSSADRVERYWKEYAAGVKLNVLCKACNVKEANERRFAASVDDAASDVTF